VKFVETPLQGAYIIELEPVEDERGFFARSWCQDEFRAHGLNAKLAQCSISFNKKRGTLRGMHYQTKPYEEVKLVRCTRGAVYDVMIDLRPDSATFERWLAVELSSENRKALYVPEGFAHGFQTLVDDVEMFYQISGSYKPEYAAGVRWDDPAFGITWPMVRPIVSGRDLSYAPFKRPC